jgi:multidrug resistance efflux pump
VKKVALLMTALAGLAITVEAAWYFNPFRDDHRFLRLPGTVEVQEVRLGSKLGGRVLSVSVREGERVSAGQELVRFEAPVLDAQHEQLKARLAAAEAELLKARRGPRPEEVSEAQAVVDAVEARLQRLHNGWRDEEKRKAKNEMDAAEAVLNQLRTEFARVDRLFQTGAGASVSRAEWETTRALREQAQKHFDAAQANYDMVMSGSRPEDVAEAAADLARAKARLTLLQNGTRDEDIALAVAQVAEARAKLQEVEVNRREAIVLAPGPAVVEVLAVRKGDLVAPSQPVVRVLFDEDLWVQAFVPQAELGKIKLNQEVEVTIVTHAGRRFPGTIERIATGSEFMPRNVQSLDERRHPGFAVKVRVDNREGLFKAGMAAEVFVPQAEGR